ncbi:hypothetical protein [Sulfolobus acidocaldarius]|uniref:hypothetical protein n=1 Tax=Sulfolobus acidocaldarius TaxID=2285 RepID=UPI000A6E5FEE|nr:hypothetical protein [Sulfolobus acidocaldarius]
MLKSNNTLLKDLKVYHHLSLEYVKKNYKEEEVRELLMSGWQRLRSSVLILMGPIETT